MDCECLSWARSDEYIFLTEHHPNCKNYDLIGDSIKLIEKLVSGIELWASEEDGVPDFLWDTYQQARLVLGKSPIYINEE